MGASGPLVELPDDLRSELKDPLGPIEDDAEELLATASRPIYAVGDVVTYHLLEAGHEPVVALIDGQTERTPVSEEISDRLTSNPWQEVTDPPATITESLIRALDAAIQLAEPTTILVDGEEDLAVLPLLLMAPDGATVIYGQPGDGMVVVTVTDEIRTQIRTLLEQFDGDVDRLLSLIE
ncbi:MAG: GTP-dependent dephospho-CoA kinase family protein [Natrialbaceae archaeon]|nr:GTP-dependent dephospho-CoA kinase family protein [Natrialbaceae archaeon]